MMKHYRFLALALLFVAASTHAAVGMHNLTVAIGGGLNFATADENDRTGIPADQDTSMTYLGGGYAVELGYLYLKDMNNFVHGVDTRLSFGQNFDGATKIDGDDPADMFGDTFFAKLNSMNITVGSTYQFGFRTSNARLMLDVLGLNLGYFTASQVMGDTTTDGTYTTKQGNHFLVGINLPLGVNYIMDNGFMIGFRHRLDIALASEALVSGTTTQDGTSSTTPADKGGAFGSGDSQQSYLAYNLTFSIGYVFGK